MRKELLVGCGHSREKRIGMLGRGEWQGLVTLDMSEHVKPDVIHNLDNFPYPFADGEFDEIHAYEVLEHCGKQGDFAYFFRQFSEFYRILKPCGHMMITAPNWDKRWAWGDPGHTRIIGFEQLIYLDRSVIEQNRRDKTSMTDYGDLWRGDFRIIAANTEGDAARWILQKN